ncbi:MAG: tetratricopeptide repeat protein [Sulfitobacter sp.]
MSKVAQAVLDEFGGAVRRAKSLKGWQLKQLSDKMDGNSGISFLSDIEKGKRAISPPTVGKLIAALELDEGWIDRFLSPEEPDVDDEVTEQDRRTDKLLSAVDKEGDAGIAEGLLITLAKEYAEGETTDLNSAYKGLQMALQTARDMAARAALPDNADAGMAAVRAEVQRLNAEADVEGAGAAIEEALARHDAAKVALLDLGVQQDRLRNDPAAAAGRLVEQLRLDAGGLSFEALRDLQDEWYVRGRDGGLAFEATVAIHLARASVDLAQGGDDRGAALNDLGNALAILGERETGTARLEEAVTAYRDALLEYTRERVPLQWAMTQNNLGNALATLGERETGTARLDEAVTAYRDALKERTRELVPLDWAMTQNNLGNALRTLGERETGTARLDEAVTAYRDALKERTRDRVPLQWARTTFNLGLLEIALFEKKDVTDHLDNAEADVSNAMEVFQQAGATQYIEMAQNVLADIKSRRT